MSKTILVFMFMLALSITSLSMLMSVISRHTRGPERTGLLVVQTAYLHVYNNTLIVEALVVNAGTLPVNVTNITILYGASNTTLINRTLAPSETATLFAYASFTGQAPSSVSFAVNYCHGNRCLSTLGVARRIS